jgi:hypothetical protein
MTRLAALLLVLALCVTGCSTHTVAGARGVIIDAATGAPVPGARITRPSIQGEWGVPAKGLPAGIAASDSRGNFDLPPVRHTLLTFTYRVKEVSAPGVFQVSADGYATNEVRGVATSSTSWRAELGQVSLAKQ